MNKLLLVSLYTFFFLVPEYGQAQISVFTKSLGDATHIEIGGKQEWRYTVTRKPGRRPRVFVQFVDVKPSDLASLRNIRDKRVHEVEVVSGKNGHALLKFKLSHKKMELFDYQTQDPSKLILDVFKDVKVVKKKKKKKDYLATMIQKGSKNSKLPAKQGGRAPASDYIETGAQEKLSGSVEDIRIKYGIFDGGDPDLKRFKIDIDGIKEEALIRASKNIYVRLPSLIVVHPYLKQLNESMPRYPIAKKKGEENKLVRLINQFNNDDKPALVLSTLKLFRKKFPVSNYEKEIEFIVADTYYKLWLRDRKKSDLDTALTRYKDILTRYKEDPLRYRILMLIGMNYFDQGNNFGVLSTFQVAEKKYKDSPFYWQMRMLLAHSLRELNRYDDSVTELKAIANDPMSGNYAIEARFRMGDVYFKKKEYQKAISEYTSSLTRHADRWEEAPNVYFNLAESQFWTRQWVKSIASFQEFLRRFPSHDFGGYAMTRIGEILEITGADDKKATGAYLESFFRYRNTPGAFIAKQNINLRRLASMKKAEAEAAFESMKKEYPKDSRIENLEPYMALVKSEGLIERHRFKEGYKTLASYYQTQSNSPFLGIFKYRIVRSLTKHIEYLQENGNNLQALRQFLNQQLWLRGSDRIDTKFAVGKAYEGMGLWNDAQLYYQSTQKALTDLSGKNLQKASVLQNLPTQEQIKLRLAKVALENRNPRKAQNILAQIKDRSKLEPEEKVEEKILTARVMEEREDFKGAISCLEDLLVSWKDNMELLAEPWLKLAKLNEKIKRKESAQIWVQKVLAATKSNPDKVKSEIHREALEMSGDLYRSQGKNREAIEAYETIVSKFGKDSAIPSVHYKIGKAFFDEKEIAQATKAWSGLKKMQNGELWARMADEQLAQKGWKNKYGKYLDRKPAGRR